MKLPEPSRTRYEIHGLHFGAPLRVQPLFWCSTAVLGVRYLADPEAGSLGYFAFWFAAVLGSLLLSALVQVIVGRLLGVRATILLHGLGSQILNLEALPERRKRVTVFLAGPLTSFALAGSILGLIECVPFPDSFRAWGWQASIGTGAMILVELNLIWGLLNILPLWPFAGGRAAVELGEALRARKGAQVALVFCLVTTGILSVLVVLELSWHLSDHYNPRYLIYLEEGIIRLGFCFVVWLGCFKCLWEGNTPTKV
jgi:Zn-dependent protease